TNRLRMAPQPVLPGRKADRRAREADPPRRGSQPSWNAGTVLRGLGVAARGAAPRDWRSRQPPPPRRVTVLCWRVGVERGAAPAGVDREALRARRTRYAEGSPPKRTANTRDRPHHQERRGSATRWAGQEGVPGNWLGVLDGANPFRVASA